MMTTIGYHVLESLLVALFPEMRASSSDRDTAVAAAVEAATAVAADGKARLRRNATQARAAMR